MGVAFPFNLRYATWDQYSTCHPALKGRAKINRRYATWEQFNLSPFVTGLKRRAAFNSRYRNASDERFMVCVLRNLCNLRIF
jgi:hypothetical protein